MSFNSFKIRRNARWLLRLTALIFLACIWAYLVYGLHQSIGYEKGIGFPEKTSSLGWAFFAALPLLTGPFVLDKTDETQKFNRGFCVVWLSVQVVFIFFTWLLPFALIPLLGLALILWPQAEHSDEKKPINLNAIWQIPTLILIIFGGLLYWWHYNPLLTDEEMIARFYEHRDEIEELAKRYQAWEPAVVSNWHGLPENVALMKKAGVKNVANCGFWPPNPYSREAAREYSDSRDERIRSKKLLAIYDIAEVSIELINKNNPKRHFATVLTSSGPRMIFKELSYIPEIAHIEGEKLYLPVSPLCNCRFDDWVSTSRIFKSTDEYPSNWTKGECVYRQFETHWFIRLCAAA